MTSSPSWSGAHPTPSPTDGFYLSSTVSRSQDRWSVSTHWTIQHSSTALPSEPSSVIVTPPPAPPTTLPPDTRGGDGSVSFNDTDLEAGVCVFAHSKQGFGFAPHAQDCDKYFQCHLSDDGKVTASVRYCPRGLFWSQENLTCVEPSGCNSVSTCRDPCEFKDDGDTYRMEGGCGMYWECHKGVSRGRSCRREEAYIPGRGCEYSPDCPYVKLASGHCDDTCDAHPLSDRSGYWTQGNFGRYKVTCLDSTRFDLASCSCKYQRYFDPVCQFKTVLEYNPDQWTNDTFTRTKTDRCENICVHPRSNRPLALTLSYRRGSVAGSRTMQKEEVLVRSKECNKGGLFALTEDGEALKVRIFSKSGQSVVTSLPLLGLNTTAWKQVSIEYSRGNVVITVSTGQLTYTVFTKGGPQVQVGVCGWQVGDPGDLSTVVDRFTGDFKQARLSRCFDYGS
ncbi:hypothetical protein Btru_075418 [Bulinus truncatus]|nr:hypothetical protein Btru_075418 [Bulinus truncatus]